MLAARAIVARFLGKPAETRRAAKSCDASPGRWWVLPLALCAVIAVFAWTYYPVARVQYRETREKVRLQAELAQLNERNARLSKDVERLKTPEGVEDYARSQLGLVKRGENIVVVIDGDESIPETRVALAMAKRPVIDSDETTTGPIGPWTGFLDLFFGVE